MSEFINLTDVVKDNIAASSLAVGETLTVRGGMFIQQEIMDFINFQENCF